jgi:diadenosine tetraphosphatase ApaH/serine/threonine PP2A family protein phosphatase
MLCNSTFDLLPMAAIVDGHVFCVHGGLSPQVPTAASISTLHRQVELPEAGPLADLCWSDPENIQEWRQNGRGAGYCFGERQVSQFNQINRFNFICRSHQLAQAGFVKYFEARAKPYQLITVWSAPNYTYRSNNQASIMKYGFDGEEKDKLIIFGPNKTRIKPLKEEEPISQLYFA